MLDATEQILSKTTLVNVSGEDKKKLTAEKLQNLFSQDSGSGEVNGRMVLS